MDINLEAVKASVAGEQVVNEGVAVDEQQLPPTCLHLRRDLDLSQLFLLAVVTTLLKPQSLSCSERTSCC